MTGRKEVHAGRDTGSSRERSEGNGPAAAPATLDERVPGAEPPGAAGREPGRDPGEATGTAGHWIASLAARHARTIDVPGSRAVDLGLKTLEQDFDRLYTAIEACAETGEAGSRVEEWLLDNRHIIDQTLEEIRKDLPATYLRQLPLVAGPGVSGGVVRVRELARVLLEESAKPLDIAWLEQIVDTYQSTTVLTIGELWALPAMLRVAILGSLAGDAGERLEPLRTERAAGGRGTEPADEIRADDVAGDIVSLRHLDAHDWRDSFERLSRVDRALRGDPAAAFSRMDFGSRDRYRGAVEQLARGARRSEIEVAEHVVNLCRNPDPEDHRTRHVGYYLVSAGRPKLERALRFQLTPWRRLTRRLLVHPGMVYFTLLHAMALGPLLALAVYLLVQGERPVEAAGVAILAAVPVTGLAVAMVNGLLTWLLSPRTLPRLNFETGIPAEFRTAVVMPVLLGEPGDVDHVLERIEINYLNNDDGQLVYAILGDWTDAPRAVMPEDEALLGRVTAGIRALNRRYGRGPEQGPFLLLHRKRLWNKAEGCWMGWERKRGKLSELNRLLGGDPGTSYTTFIGERSALSGVQFVITLDADTHLPPGAARRLVGTIAHPLNRAVVEGERLKAGYSILQPRLEIDPDSTQSTRFTEVFAGDTTLDLYTHATSDVYHDLFAEGIYAGKGLYDWRVFEETLRQRIPENALLSHDLLEGVHGRTALVSDVVLLEQFPASGLAYMRRLHRWVRGDWQLLPWLAPLVPSSTGTWFRNPLSVIHQWKIVDNLRRSLQPPAVLALLVLAWLGLIAGHVALWTAVFAVFMGAPLIAEIFNIAGPGLARPATLPQRLREAPHVLRDRFEHWLLSLVLLPFESYVVADAIGRTLYRLLVSKRRLLEWTSARDVQRRLGSGNGVLMTWREMWVSPALAVTAFVVLLDLHPAALPGAGALLLAWLAAPQIMWWVNRPLHEPSAPLSGADRERLRRIARRTWFFFEQFMGPDNHWLPPDNFQEEPRAIVARRTSPTNIGMALVSALAAYDFGYIDGTTLAARLRNTFEVMERLERFRGHWLNWYETSELHPLQPRYVSTVDSGNLAAALIVLARGMEEISFAPIHRPAVIRGITDTVAVLRETLEQASGGKRIGGGALTRRLDSMRRLLLEAHAPPEQWRCIKRLQESEVAQFNRQLLELVEKDELGLGREELGQLRAWLDELRRQLRRSRRSLETLQPWLPSLEDIPAVYGETPIHSPAAGDVARLTELLAARVSLRQAAAHYRGAAALAGGLATHMSSVRADEARREGAAWATGLRENLESAATASERLLSEFRELAALADHWVAEMDFRFLYDETRHLFRIGYNVAAATPDPNHYDLLASEARLAGFIAIAKGDAPARHWLHLGRPFRHFGGATVLMSWGATLFEYLMPSLFMTTPHDTLMRRACRSAISMHQDFASRQHIPWGISESGYYQLDEQQHYQYRAFGVPGLGFRRDLGDRLVVAPYASLMALPFDPSSVLANLAALESVQAVGLYGLYEAVDFGRAEKAASRRARVVRSYMSHHQGMAMLAVDNFLAADVMVHRFHRDRRIARVSMLLHEGLPRRLPELRTLEAPRSVRHFTPRASVETHALSVDGEDRPRYNVLSNGHYTVVTNAAGGGGAQWDGIALTRWQPDPTRDEGGQWVYVKDVDDGTLLSIGRDPTGPEAGECTVYVGPHLAQYQRRAVDLFCQMDIALSSQHDIEARRITIRNDGRRQRRLMVATCAELVLAPPREFMRHPAFSKLFVESECLEEERVVLFRRRPRSSLEKPLYLAHTVVTRTGADYRVGWETDRSRFLGRYGRAAHPRALNDGLSGFTGATGPVLDAMLGGTVEMVLPPGAAVELAFLTAVGRSRSRILSTLQSYRSLPRVRWIFEQARMQTEQELHHLQIEPGDLPVVTDLLSAALVSRAALRTEADLGAVGPLQSVLWSRGISGDRPLILVRVRDDGNTHMVEQLLKAHTYLCSRQIPIDLLMMDENSVGYAQPTRDRLEQLTARVRARTQRRLAGSVFVVPGKELSQDARAGLMAAAQLLLDTDGGSLAEQLARGAGSPSVLPPFVPVRSTGWRVLPAPALERPEDLLFDNGVGGFSADGSEYVIHLEPGERTPAPWSNVLANPRFGCLLTESGSSCTWAGNSSEQRLTPWPNDPVSDRSGEVVYLRDEETGRVWTPTPQPGPDGNAYQVRHGAGYSEYRHNSSGLTEVYRVHVDRDESVKLCRLTLANHAPWSRRLTVTFYVEWVLGTLRTESAPHLQCSFDADANALLARNTFSRLAASATAFVACDTPPHGLSVDRTEFLGPGGDTDSPAALHRIGLSGTLQTRVDPCAAFQIHVDLPAGATQAVHFVLGQGETAAEASRLARRFRSAAEAQASFERVRRFWESLLGGLRVETPEPATDLLVNRWLLYQVVSARLWGRVGYYQASGGYGFRDQLQDVMALTRAAPGLAREHILRAASRQFQDGDVLHWWHEAPLRGVRTRCSDDLLWLPFTVSHYLRCTGDDSILHEEVAYLAGPELRRDEHEHYTEFSASEERGSIYEHCCRAIERAAVVGPHGLPTIGSGDWNDGLNRVGTQGKGESVWLAWFLIRVCHDFAPWCERSGDPALAGEYLALARDLQQQAESEAWDGRWYRRAYYDDGTPLGSAESRECRIDLIAQAWAVLSTEQPGEHMRLAMESAFEQLVREDDRIILLLAPPFDRDTRDPGYIKGYPPGVRENGAQYTHAATWAVWAAAVLGENDRAMSLFRMLNPILRCRDEAELARYRVEPYVLAGDIYSLPPHTGRGGWTWYTGAAAWLYRVGIEVLLGLKQGDGELGLRPRLPSEWTDCRVHLRYGRSEYRLEFRKPPVACLGEARVTLDGTAVEGCRISLVDDGREHVVEVELVPTVRGHAGTS